MNAFSNGAYSGAPIDDDTLRWALEDAGLAALMAALTHFTGETSHLYSGQAPVPDLFGSDEDQLDQQRRAEIRQHAFEVLRCYFDGDRPVDSIDAERQLELIRFIGGEPPPDGYEPLLLEELDVGCDDLRAPDFSDLPASARDDCPVVIIGAGMSGILAGHRCKQAGLPFVIIDKDPEPSGTWFENTYPGCRVDTNNHVYAYSFVHYPDWPMYFSTRENIYDYFNYCVDHFGLREHLRLGTRVESLHWDDAAAEWTVTTETADEERSQQQARAVITAVGQLNVPRIPDLPGRDEFRGTIFHSATWDHSVDLRGKRVVTIGTGASATQFVPEIAPLCGQLTVFQRTPPWPLPTPRYHESISEQQKWLFRHVPYYERWYRLWTFRMTGADGALPYLYAEEGWPGTDNTVSAANHELREALVGYIGMQLQDRPDLFTKSIPDYPPGGKRPLRDCGVWFDALKRDNVELVANEVTAFCADGVVTADGTVYPADVVICGTGFQASNFLCTMDVVGSGGYRLDEAWADAARAFKGTTVPGFPNLFTLYGPNTNIVVGSSIIFFVENQVRYVMDLIKHLLSSGKNALEVRADACTDWSRRMDEWNARTAWGAPGVRSWYKNADGIVTQNWPGTHLEFWQEMQALDPADFMLR